MSFDIRQWAAVQALRRGDPGRAIELLRAQVELTVELRAALAAFLEGDPTRGKPSKSPTKQIIDAAMARDLRELVKETTRARGRGSRDSVVEEFARQLNIAGLSDRLYRPNRKRTR